MSGLSLSRDGRRAIGESQDRSLVVWDAKTGKVMRTLTAHIPAGGRPSGMSAMKMTADGRRAMTSGTNNPLILWDVASGSIVTQIQNWKIHPSAADMSADGRRVVVMTDEKQILVVDLPSGHKRQLAWAAGRLMSVALSADGRRVVAGTDFRVPSQGYQHPDDSPLLVWDLETEAPPRRLDGHGGGITRISLSADGRRAVSCALDCAAIYWDLERGAVIRRLTGHKEWLWGVALSPDERYAISGGADRKMILWDLESGEAITWLYLNGPIQAMDWAGNRIAIKGGLVHFLELEW